MGETREHHRPIPLRHAEDQADISPSLKRNAQRKSREGLQRQNKPERHSLVVENASTCLEAVFQPGDLSDSRLHKALQSRESKDLISL